MILTPRIVKLSTRTGIDIHRTLPNRHIRTIGAWCFVDHFGPTNQEDAMSVAAHPHVGLQTVSWLFAGEVEHRDSLGSVQVIHPGELNLMTAGRGVAHSELSLPKSPTMHGVQLWTVLPDKDRNSDPSFDHYKDLPEFVRHGLRIRLFVGDFMGHHSPAKVFSDLIGAEMEILASSEAALPLHTDFEYGVLLVEGDLVINSSELPLNSLYYSAPGASQITLMSKKGAKIVLLGGKPFSEKIVMWWNFIGRTHEEIKQMRDDWNNHTERFPAFTDRIHGWIPAPEMPNLKLHARGNTAHES